MAGASTCRQLPPVLCSVVGLFDLEYEWTALAVYDDACLVVGLPLGVTVAVTTHVRRASVETVDRHPQGLPSPR